jgi:hypothetical protein
MTNAASAATDCIVFMIPVSLTKLTEKNLAEYWRHSLIQVKRAAKRGLGGEAFLFLRVLRGLGGEAFARRLSPRSAAHCSRE